MNIQERINKEEEIAAIVNNAKTALKYNLIYTQNIFSTDNQDPQKSKLACEELLVLINHLEQKIPELKNVVESELKALELSIAASE